MKRIFILVAAVALLPSLTAAQFTSPTDGFNNNGTRPAQFLKFAVGARAAAMGESFAAVASDATALYWNPAGIGNLNDLEIHLSHMEYVADINFEFAGLVIPTRSFNLGFSVAAWSMDDEPITTAEDPTGESGLTWSAGSFAAGVTFSRALTDRFAIGITGKYIQENIYNESANALAVDIGSVYNTGISGIKIGMAMTNFGGKLRADGRDLNVGGVDVAPTRPGNVTSNGDLRTSSWPLPLNFRVGLSAELFKTETGALLLASDFNHPTDADERINFGGEYSLRNRIFLRGGYKFNYDEQSFTFGGGLNLPIAQNYNFIVDYAYHDFGILGETHRFSIGLRL
ncbi:MAG: PorV/PorQ family protein [bacterium]